MCEIFELTFLIVDSDPRSLQEMCDLVRSLGAERLLCAEDAESALSWLLPEENGDIDVIMTNNKLSGMNGFLFINKARTLCPDKQILMYSNCTKPTAYLLALTVGATDYIDKDNNFAQNVREKLPQWIGVAQEQCRIEENYRGK